MSDLISRQAVIDWIKTRLYQTALNNDEYITSYAKVCEDIAENRIDIWVNEVKSVEPERKTWKWIHVGDGGYCSECGHDMPWFFVNWNYVPQETPFCPNCGAKMEGADG